MAISYSMKKYQHYVLCYKMRNNYNEKVVKPIMKSRKTGLVDDIIQLSQKPSVPGPRNKVRGLIGNTYCVFGGGAWVQAFADFGVILQYHLLVPTFYFSYWAKSPSHHNYFSFYNNKCNAGVFSYCTK